MLVEKIRPPSFILQTPEEQTDNWDDDFEEGISFTKLQGERLASCIQFGCLYFPPSSGKAYIGWRQVWGERHDYSANEKSSSDLNTAVPTSRSYNQTHSWGLLGPHRRGGRIHGGKGGWFQGSAITHHVSLHMNWQELQLKNQPKRGLFHPDDIKTVGLKAEPGPLSAPPTLLNRKSSRPMLTPIGLPAAPTSAQPMGTHGRTASVSTPTTGSFGKAQARQLKRMQSQAEFGKYAEDDEEDYDDVFGKPNGTSERLTRLRLIMWADSLW
jgi:hypothetical protein